MSLQRTMMGLRWTVPPRRPGEVFHLAGVVEATLQEDKSASWKVSGACS